MYSQLVHLPDPRAVLSLHRLTAELRRQPEGGLAWDLLAILQNVTNQGVVVYTIYSFIDSLYIARARTHTHSCLHVQNLHIWCKCKLQHQSFLEPSISPLGGHCQEDSKTWSQYFGGIMYTGNK